MTELQELRNAITLRLAQMPLTAAKQLVGAVLEGTTLDAIDLEVVGDLGADPEDPDAATQDVEAKALSERGDAPGLGVLFEQVAEDLDSSWVEIGALFTRLCEIGPPSADVSALALLLSRPTWAEVVAQAERLRADDRLGRLALAAVALRTEGDAPLAFLRAEASRFFASLHQRSSDTAALAVVGLLRRHDAPTISALAEAVRTKPPHGPAARALLALMGPDPAFAQPVEALQTSLEAQSAEPD